VARVQENQQKQQEYMGRLYGQLNLRVFWGTAAEFCAELLRRRPIKS